MALRTIRETGDPILRKTSKPVKEMTPRTEELIDDLIENMHEAEGVGLAAVQVGILKRIAVVWVPEPEPEEAEEGQETEPVNELTHSSGEEIVMMPVSPWKMRRGDKTGTYPAESIGSQYEAF